MDPRNFSPLFCLPALAIPAGAAEQPGNSTSNSQAELANHLWSFAGSNGRQDVSATLMQPFLTYTTKTYTTLGINTESTYDWGSSRYSSVWAAVTTHPSPTAARTGVCASR